MTSQKSTIQSKAPFLATLLLFGLVLAGCHSDRVMVDRKDPKTPQFAYRLDELALLQMAADDIQDQERDKHYGQIYDDFASPEFKEQTSRRRFLIWGNCAENYLGGLEEYDRNELGFFRDQSKNKSPIDNLVRTVHRTRFVVKERMGFIYDGVHFKLRNWTWITNDKPFQQCMADSAVLEGTGKPIEASSDNHSSSPESQQTASSSESSTRSNRVEPDSAPKTDTGSSSDKVSEKHSESSSDSSSAKDESKDTSKDDSNDAAPTPETPLPSAPTSLRYARARWKRPVTTGMPKGASPSVKEKPASPASESTPNNRPPVPGQG